MKFTENFFGYCKCESESEQQDLMALCDLIGLVRYDKTTYDYALAPYVLITGYLLSTGTYQQSSAGSHIGSQNYSASEFIKSNF